MNRKIKYDIKHLGKGDDLQPLNGKLRVFNMRLCPYAQRTILALNAKNIDYEVVNVDLQNKPDWLFEKNPSGTVPILELSSGNILYESLLTVEYIDEAYPTYPLLPSDPLDKVLEKMLVKDLEPIEALYLKMFKWPGQVTAENVIAYHRALKHLENTLKLRGTKFFGGGLPAYADLMIWPWFERFLAYDHDSGEQYPRLIEYISDMYANPIVQSYQTPMGPLRILHEQFSKGTFNVDITLHTSTFSQEPYQ